ncbi:hypothetical protein HDU76_010053 [Blyttiomyces sp. JEL0837]|nr:hypothetical protein HDU76_010053 [Blyttiomyces sp. JEL0837]
MGWNAIERSEELEKRFANALSNVISSNPNLETLSLHWPWEVMMPKVFESAYENLKSLKRLHVGGFDDMRRVSRLVSVNPNITSLRLLDIQPHARVAELLGPEGYINSNATNDSFLSFTTTLESLELDGIGNLTTALPLLSQFTNLVKLRVSTTRMMATMPFVLTDDVAAVLFRSLRSLRWLEIPIVGSEPVIELARCCHDLEYLDVVDGAQISGQAIVLLSKGCPRLSHLHLGHATQIMDTTIQILSRTHSHTLKSLTLPFGNTNLTIKSLEALATGSGSINSDNDNGTVALESLMNLPGAQLRFEDLERWVPRMKRLKVLGVCWVGVPGGPAGLARVMLRRDQEEKLKGLCRRLKYFVNNM